MPPLPLLLLHEIFPSFPPFWAFLAAGLVIGGAITAIARWHARRAPVITTLSGANRPPLERGRVASSPTPSRLAPVRALMDRQILGIPWSIPGYSLVIVLAGGLASLMVPVAAIVVAPGYMLMFVVAFRSSWFDHAPAFLPYLIMVVGSWAFWTLCAGVVWRVTRRPSEGAPSPNGQPGLNIGRPRS